MSDDPVPDDPLATAVAVVGDPTAGRRRLPALLGLLDHDEERVRLAGAWALASVATATPDVVGPLTRRLADRLASDPALASELLFAYLSARFPDTVDAELSALDEEPDSGSGSTSPGTGTGGPSGGGSRGPPGASPAIGSQFSLGNRDVGRTTTPDAASSPGPRGIYEAATGDPSDGAATGAESTGDDEAAADADDGGPGVPEDDEANAGVDADDEGSDAASEPGDGSDATAGRAGPSDAEATGARDDYDRVDERRAADRRRGDVPLTIGYPVQEAAGEWTSVDTLIDVAYESRFDQLTVYGRRSGRYGDVYRSLGTVGGREYSVGLVLFDRPDTRRESFATALVERLRRWREVADHEGVVTVHDWGREPRPWAALEYVGETLAARGPMGPAEARWNALGLARSLAAVHENGFVHGGLDPGNVGYSGDVFGDGTRQAPLLANLCLMDVFRMHFDPTKRLDARYAAPEYYDRDFGTLDHLTDVYHLGAVVHRLFTGKPPYDGDYTTVRNGILSGEPPRPSDVADVPAGVDEIVRKAMARQKIGRYETVEYLARDLRALSDEAPDDREGSGSEAGEADELDAAGPAGGAGRAEDDADTRSEGSPDPPSAEETEGA